MSCFSSCWLLKGIVDVDLDESMIYHLLMDWSLAPSVHSIWLCCYVIIPVVPDKILKKD